MGLAMSDYDERHLISDLIDLNIRPKDWNRPFMSVKPDSFKTALREQTKERFQRNYFRDYTQQTVGRWLNHPKKKPMSADICARLVDALARMWNEIDTGDAQRDSTGAGISVTRKRVIQMLLGDFSHNEKAKDYDARQQSLTASRQTLALLASEIELQALDLHAIAKAVCDAISAAYVGAPICDSARKLRGALDEAEMGARTAREMKMAVETLLADLTAHDLLTKDMSDKLMELFPETT